MRHSVPDMNIEKQKTREMGTLHLTIEEEDDFTGEKGEAL